MLDSNASWVAVMTYPQAEFSVARHFEEGPNPIEYYLPLLRMRDRRYRRDPMREKPMFPCYLFARINNKQIYQTRTTTGVIGIVSFDHSIITVPQADIDAVRTFEASQRKIYIMDTHLLVRGAETEVVSGEFAGLRGVVVKKCKEGNFCVSISAMNKSFVLHLRRDELMPVGSASAALL